MEIKWFSQCTLSEESMTFHTEHLQLKPVLDLAQKLDIATNPHPQAISKLGAEAPGLVHA